jgi:hypothetical protein
MVALEPIIIRNAGAVRVLVGPFRVRSVRKEYTIVEATMAYRMIV